MSAGPTSGVWLRQVIEWVSERVEFYVPLARHISRTYAHIFTVTGATNNDMKTAATHQT